MRKIFFYDTNNCLTAFLIFKYNLSQGIGLVVALTTVPLIKNTYKALLLTDFIRFAWTFKLERSHNKLACGNDTRSNVLQKRKICVDDIGYAFVKLKSNLF